MLKELPQTCERRIQEKGSVRGRSGGKGGRFGASVTVFVLVLVSADSAFPSEPSSRASVQEVCVHLCTYMDRILHDREQTPAASRRVTAPRRV